ncbi:MAG TPA: DUF805 domain-containing protein [Allosphingosinicella sp.]
MNQDDGRFSRRTFVRHSLLLVALAAGATLLRHFLETLGGRLSSGTALRLGGMLLLGLALLILVAGLLVLAAGRARDIGWRPGLILLLLPIAFPIMWPVLALMPGRSAGPEGA